jgi:hypothetical protein
MPEFMRLYRAEPDTGEPGGAMTFIASTPGPKRDGMDLDQQMWYLDNYRRNPVFLWAHDYLGRSLPIGRAEVAVDGGQLRCAVSFDQKDDFARQVEQKYRDGYLHAVSVGWNNVQLDGREMYDLLDISAVPVPGDPDALKERQLAGMRGIYSDIQRLLDAEVVAEARALAEDDAAPAEPEPPPPPAEIDYRALSRAILAEMGEIPAEPVQAESERGGAVISKRNLDDLKRAVELISAVIERAAKPVEPPADEEEDDDKEQLPQPKRDEGEPDAATLAALTRISELLKTTNNKE